MRDFRQNERQQYADFTINDLTFQLNISQLDDTVKMNNVEVRYINDVSQIISTGRDTRRFPVEITLGDVDMALDNNELSMSATHDLEADVLVTMLMDCTSNNPGKFVHPFNGEFPVVVDGQIKRSTNLVNSIFVTTVSFTLVEITPLLAEPADLGAKIDALAAENKKMMDALKVTELNKKSLLNKMADIYKGYNSIMNKVNFYTQKSLNTIRDVNSKIKKGYYDIVLAPANIINSSKEILNLGVQQTGKTLKEATNVYYENAFSNPLAKRPNESENSARFDITEYDELDNSDFSLYDPNSEDFNETLINLQNMNTSLILMCESLNQTEVRDHTTITNLRDLLFFLIDELVKQYEIMISTYDLTKPIINIGVFRDLKSAISKQYNALNLIKKEEYTIEQDCNITQLLIKLYDTYNEEVYLDFVANNPDLNSVILFKEGQKCLK